MNRSKNVHELKQAMASLDIPIFNCVAADSEGNISYLFNAAIPKRNPKFDSDRPLDRERSCDGLEGNSSD